MITFLIIVGFFASYYATELAMRAWSHYMNNRIRREYGLEPKPFVIFNRTWGIMNR